MSGVGDLVQRTDDGHTVEHSVAERSGGRVMLCAVCTVSWLSLKTKVNGLLVVWPQNHWDGLLVVWHQNYWYNFLWFGLKIGGDSFLWLGLKTGGDGFSWFGLKTGGSGFPVWASKSAAMVW
jgi:hypothetical protein